MMKEFMSKDSFSVVISLLGVNFVLFLVSVILVITSRHTALQLSLNFNMIKLFSRSPKLHKSAVLSRCCLRVFVHLLVYLPSLRELKLSGARSQGGGHCWLRHHRGTMVAVAGGGWKGNRATFPVEMGLSLPQLLLQLLQKPGKKACRHADGHIQNNFLFIMPFSFYCTYSMSASNDQIFSILNLYLEMLVYIVMDLNVH